MSNYKQSMWKQVKIVKKHAYAFWIQQNILSATSTWSQVQLEVLQSQVQVQVAKYHKYVNMQNLFTVNATILLSN